MDREEIYNTWLKVTARQNNRPYRKRIDFDGLKPDDAASLEKLCRIANGFPGINLDLFFSAGYELHKNDFAGGKAFIPLSEFAKPSAIKNYLLFVDNVDEKPITDEIVMRGIMDGFMFIKSKCESNNYKLSHYIGSAQDGMPYEWIMDFANHKLSPYNIIAFDLIGFDTANAVRKTTARDEEEMIFGGRFEDKIRSKIDKMSESDQAILIDILKRFNTLISKSIDKSS